VNKRREVGDLERRGGWLREERWVAKKREDVWLRQGRWVARGGWLREERGGWRREERWEVRGG
jgi:hypothetical protein